MSADLSLEGAESVTTLSSVYGCCERGEDGERDAEHRRRYHHVALLVLQEKHVREGMWERSDLVWMCTSRSEG